MPFRLTPPTQITLLTSVIVAIVAVVLRLTHVEIPLLSAHTLAILAIAYLVLLAGNVFEGI
jgi:hypothetical protein